MLNFTINLVSKYGTVMQDLNLHKCCRKRVLFRGKTRFVWYLYTVGADELLPLELGLLPEEGPLAVELVLAGHDLLGVGVLHVQQLSGKLVHHRHPAKQTKPFVSHAQSSGSRFIESGSGSRVLMTKN
jgi:hypothetical protein